jgi:GT2 family glycosyltransferase
MTAAVDEDPPAISVVVATRDRPQALERCLMALAWQIAPPLELVVVDDGSADPDAVDAAVDGALRGAAHAPPARIVRGAGRGPAAARNLGVRAATGAIVLFIDDDCVAEPGWVQALAAACAEGGAAAGVTIPDAFAGRAAAASQLLTNTLQLASLDPATGKLGFAPTCNLACRTDVLQLLPFDESFALAAGEDRDWCSRLASAGVALRFVPEARVEHRPCIGLGGLLRQQLRYGRGAVRFRAAGDARRLSGRAFYLRLAVAGVRAGPSVAALVMLAQAAVATGALLESLPTRRRQ